MEADFDWRETRGEIWNIMVETDAGSLTVADGGKRMLVDGQVRLDEPDREYAAIYRRFAELAATGGIDVDLSPLQHVADAFLLGRRHVRRSLRGGLSDDGAAGLGATRLRRAAGRRRVELVCLRAEGIEARVMTYGATLQALLVADRDGRIEDVVLGHDDLDGYVETRSFYGATIGRYANRIARGTFAIDGETFTVPANDGENALHGGAEGFDRHLWEIAENGGGRGALRALHPHQSAWRGGFPANSRPASPIACARANSRSSSMPRPTARPSST